MPCNHCKFSKEEKGYKKIIFFQIDQCIGTPKILISISSKYECLAIVFINSIVVVLFSLSNCGQFF